MRQVPWSAYDGKVCVGVGTVTAEGEREALEQVLQGKAKDFKPRPDRWYTVRAGGVTASSLGSEMGAVAAQTGKDSQGDTHTNSANRAAERRQLDEAARKVLTDALKKTTAGVDRLAKAMDGLTESVKRSGSFSLNIQGLPLDQVEPCPCGNMQGALGNNDGDLVCDNCGRGVMLTQDDPLDYCPRYSAGVKVAHEWALSRPAPGPQMEQCVACGRRRPVAPSPTPVLNYVDCTRSPNGKHHWLGISMVYPLSRQEECRHCHQRRIIAIPPPSISQLDPGRAPYDVSVLGLAAQQRCRALAIEVARNDGTPSYFVPSLPTSGEIDTVNGTVLLDYHYNGPSGDLYGIRVAISHKELLSFLP